MFLGAALIVGALLLFNYNQREAALAEQAGMDLLPQLVKTIEDNKGKETVATEVINDGSEATEIYEQMLDTPIEFLDPSDLKMKEVIINGYAYIGYLSIPELELELPVMADWDYKRLRRAPCRYMGSVRGEDLVIMAHNYATHFGNLSKLAEGDRVLFTDMDGNVTVYEVVAHDILDPQAVEEMTSGDFDLTLFTCTYGGANRVTVYCQQVS